MTKLAVTLMTAALFFAGIHAFKFDRRPEDDMLDKWLKEQVAETQSSNGAAHGTENLGFATPGHVEEHEYMTAFFENQDHDAFADTAGHGVDNHVDNYLADFFGYGESQNNDKAAVENEDVMGKNVEDFFNNEPETASQTTHQQRQQAAVMKDDPMGKFLSDFFNNEPEPAPQNAPQWREEAVVVNEEKDDGDAESFISDFFDSKNSMERKPGYAIFAKVEEGEEDNAATNNVNLAMLSLQRWRKEKKIMLLQIMLLQMAMLKTTLMIFSTQRSRRSLHIMNLAMLSLQRWRKEKKIMLLQIMLHQMTMLKTTLVIFSTQKSRRPLHIMNLLMI
jgi:hypothetical protein